jgi:hypothetical protein
MLLFKVTNEYHLYDGDKAIATTIVGNPMLLPILSRKNCDEVFGVVDVEKLAFNYAIEIGILHTTLAYSKHFKAGFNKSMELNKDKMFTLEDIGKAIMFGRWEATDKAAYNNFIQSLQQPTEIEVEIVKEVGTKLHDDGREFFMVEGTLPKLDSEGCLILKKKL